MIDVRDTLREHQNDGIYYKSDHHWTTFGAYLAFREACVVMGLDPDKVSYGPVKVTDSFDGALKSKSGYFFAPSDSIELNLPANDEPSYLVTYVDEQRISPSLYKDEALDQKDKYQVFLGGNPPLVRIEGLSENNNVLLIIKDSYANSFIPFMAEEYAKVVVVDPRYYFDDLDALIASERVTDVLFLYNATTFAEDTSLSSMINASADAAPVEGDGDDSAPDSDGEAMDEDS